jgi:hypothetical protein
MFPNRDEEGWRRGAGTRRSAPLSLFADGAPPRRRRIAGGCRDDLRAAAQPNSIAALIAIGGGSSMSPASILRARKGAAER